jgi:hypothetical protein
MFKNVIQQDSDLGVLLSAVSFGYMQNKKATAPRSISIGGARVSARILPQEECIKVQHENGTYANYVFGTDNGKDCFLEEYYRNHLDGLAA